MADMNFDTESAAISFLEAKRALEAAFEEARLLHGSRKGLRLQLAVEISGPMPMAIRAEAAQLGRLSRSLIESAIESLGGGEGVVWVRLTSDARAVTVEIEDNGRGLSEAFIAKLETKGLLTLGEDRLSLRQSRELAETHGWSMETQARLGVGARVVIGLPRVDTPTQDFVPPRSNVRELQKLG